MDGGAAGNELAALDRALAAAEIADETARLAHQQHTGGDVPDIQVGLPETIEAARRNPGEIEARRAEARSEEHTSELQSLMRISYAVFCLKKKITTKVNQPHQ